MLEKLEWIKYLVFEGLNEKEFDEWLRRVVYG
jgi:hypothetical protein